LLSACDFIVVTNNVQTLFNALTGTLKTQSNEPLYSNTVIGTLAVDGWAVTFGTARKELGGLRPVTYNGGLDPLVTNDFNFMLVISRPIRYRTDVTL